MNTLDISEVSEIEVKFVGGDVESFIIPKKEYNNVIELWWAAREKQKSSEFFYFMNTNGKTIYIRISRIEEISFKKDIELWRTENGNTQMQDAGED